MGFYVAAEKKLNILLSSFLFLCRGYLVGFITHSSEVRISGKSAIVYYQRFKEIVYHRPKTKLVHICPLCAKN